MTEESNFTVRIIDDEDSTPLIQEETISDVVEDTLQEEVTDVLTEEVVEDTVQVEEEVINDSDFFFKLNELYGKDFKSIDDIFNGLVQKEDFPEDISKFLQFRKDTGRGMGDYLELTKDWSEVSDDDKIRKYLKENNPELDDDDIVYELEQFIVDEEYDTDKEVKQKNRERKKILLEADKFLKDSKAKYYAPLESNAKAEIPTDYEEMKKALGDIEVENTKIEKENAEVREHFMAETKRLFNNEFKGFEFYIGDAKTAYIPQDVQSIMINQSDVTNFISKHVDSSGRVKNASEYHKALSMAMNPDDMAKFFYDKGKADAITSVQRDSKNIDMKPRTTGDASKPTSGFSFKITD